MGAILRAKVATSLAKVVRDGQSLSDILPSFESFEVQDRALARELISGSLREYFRLKAITNQLLSKPMKNKDADVECLIIIGLYQLYSMRIPDHAVVSETVQATLKLKKKWAKGLVNALLRKSQRDQSRLIETAEKDKAVSASFPDWLYQRIKHDWQPLWNENIADVYSGSHQRAPLTLRINSLKISVEKYQQLLLEDGISSQTHALAESALVLDKSCNVLTLPGYDEGLFSVQDCAAQLIAPLLEPHVDDTILDACAAPGGKTSHILELTNNKATLIALDQSEKRLERLSSNLHRLGLRATTRVGDASDPQVWNEGQTYDRILCDAPCSATGIIRRHPDILVLRRDSDIQTLVDLQAQILDALWQLLKPGGVLVYSTCSILKAENSEQIKHFLERTPSAQIITEYPFDTSLLNSDKLKSQSLTQTESDYGLQIFPSELAMDGFFMAKIVKQKTNET